jgi:serine/threonine protein phosphatase 1
MEFPAGSHIGAWHEILSGDDGCQLFVIGDVHGQATALKEALATISTIPRKAARRKLVFLGDIIDRGPQSIGAINLVLAATQAASVDEVVVLPGNHELMLLDALDDPMRYMGDWLDNGGAAVIAEASLARPVRLLQDFAEIAHQIVPPDFITTMRAAPSHYRAGNLLLVHAGLAPDQDPQTFLNLPKQSAYGAHWAWIRRPFLDWRGGWGPDAQWLVVHGHTPVATKTSDPSRFLAAANRLRTHGRICLDAGSANGLSQVGWAEFFANRFRLALSRAS